MELLDWIALGVFFAVLIGIGFFSMLGVRQSKDYFVGGGKLPWWVGGISHHVGGYSAVVFTVYASCAYVYGFSLYVWWALGFGICCIIGAVTIAPLWSRLRQRLGVQSPTEYLKLRYNVATQQLVVWSGVCLKLLDLAGKTAAMAIILKGFAGVPFMYGVLLVGIVGLIYNTLGGFMASTRNDVFQFLVQLAGGLVMFIFVFMALKSGQSALPSGHATLLGGHGTDYFGMWELMDPKQFWPFRGEYDIFFAIGFWLALFFASNGGNWGAGLRYMAAPRGKMASRSAMLSGILYLIWPLVLFAPMWSAVLLCPGIVDPPSGTLAWDELPPTQLVYTKLAVEFLPVGLVGVVLASMFAASISTIAGDCNAVASVIARDIAPCFTNRLTREDGQTPMWFARSVALFYTSLTIIIALNNAYFGGVVGLVIKWFSGLIAPISVALVFGMFWYFRRCGSCAAIISTLAGILIFLGPEIYWRYHGWGGIPLNYALFAPAITSLVFFWLFAVLSRTEPSADVEALLKGIQADEEA